MDYKILTVGDSAVSIEFGKSIDPKICKTARAARMKLEQEKLKGVTELVQTYCSVMVHYNPLITGYDRLCRMIHAHLKTVDLGMFGNEKFIMDIPVCYGGIFGPDMETVCEHTGLTEEEVIRLHSEPDYQIYMMGFLPGFVYLGGMNPKLETPRLMTPRQRLEAGSVGIAAKQTGMYPLPSPGGWQIIGRTPLKLYDHDRDEPILYNSGDYLHYVPISEAEFYRIRELVEKDEYEYKWRREEA